METAKTIQTVLSVILFIIPLIIYADAAIQMKKTGKTIELPTIMTASIFALIGIGNLYIRNTSTNIIAIIASIVISAVFCTALIPLTKVLLEEKRRRDKEEDEEFKTALDEYLKNEKE